MTPSIEPFAGSRILTERASAEFVCLSLPQFRRLRYMAQGPRYVRLSERRLGYRVSDLVGWLEARTSDRPPEAA